MDTAEWLTRGTVWLALSLYVAAEMVVAFSSRAAGCATARWLNGFGVAAFVGHVACAFHFHHQWSHAVAYADTARQTVDFTGWNWGGGLYLNYLFMIVWLGELTWSSLGPMTYAGRRSWIGWAARGFFMFMIFNGAFVFARHPMRWFGLVLCVLLAVTWWQRWKDSDQTREPKAAEVHD